MIEVWKWDGREPSALTGAPDWVVEAYQRGQLLTIRDRKTNVKELTARTKYGNMIGLAGCYVMRFDYKELLLLDEIDRKRLMGMK